MGFQNNSEAGRPEGQIVRILDYLIICFLSRSELF